jgi:hypothetical protein
LVVLGECGRDAAEKPAVTAAAPTFPMKPRRLGEEILPEPCMSLAFSVLSRDVFFKGSLFIFVRRIFCGHFRASTHAALGMYAQRYFARYSAVFQADGRNGDARTSVGSSNRIAAECLP